MMDEILKREEALRVELYYATNTVDREDEILKELEQLARDKEKLG